MPNHLVLISHDGLAEGALGAMRLIAGDVADARIVSVTTIQTVETVSEQLEAALDSFESDGPTVVISDIPGGSPTQAALAIMPTHPDVYFLTGLSLALLLEVAMLPLEPGPQAREWNLQQLRGAVRLAQEGIGLLEDLSAGLAPDSSDADSDEL